LSGGLWGSGELDQSAAPVRRCVASDPRSRFDADVDTNRQMARSGRPLANTVRKASTRAALKTSPKDDAVDV